MSIATTEMHVGQEMPSFTKKAKLTPPPGGYPWGSPHNEAYAKSIGFKGALMAGEVTLAYVSESLLNFFGEGWVKGGKIEVSFIGGGVVDGEMVTVKGTRRMRRQMPWSLPRMPGLWLAASQISNWGRKSKNSSNRKRAVMVSPH